MSSKKQFDHIEEKIKQAAENNLPLFDEKGWQLMEAKLDKEDKKRRPFLWWFVLPLLLAGAWGGYQTLKQPVKEIVKEEGIKKEIEKQQDKAPADLNREKIATGNENNQNKVVDVTAYVDKTGIDDAAIKKENGLRISVDKKQSDKGVEESSQIFNRRTIKGENKGKMLSVVSANEPMDEEPAEIKDKNDLKENTVTITGKNEEPANDTKTGSIVSDDKPAQTIMADDKKTVAATEETKQEKKKEEKNKGTDKGFYLLASGGADAGATKLFSFSNSNITPKYGLGIGYQFDKKFSVQTGVYVANKKYVAGPKDYTVKEGSAMAAYAYQLDKIKASCLVYEIPLTVKYDVVNKKSFILYITAGMSSYILKEEKYDCFYNYYGATYEHEWQYNGNKHFFSIGDFSIGIEKKISPHFSVLAEPSLSIPVSGVGDGKIKMYSTTLQLGLKYYLFKKQ